MRQGPSATSSNYTNKDLLLIPAGFGRLTLPLLICSAQAATLHLEPSTRGTRVHSTSDGRVKCGRKGTYQTPSYCLSISGWVSPELNVQVGNEARERGFSAQCVIRASIAYKYIRMLKTWEKKSALKKTHKLTSFLELKKEWVQSL